MRRNDPKRGVSVRWGAAWRFLLLPAALPAAVLGAFLYWNSGRQTHPAVPLLRPPSEVGLLTFTPASAEDLARVTEAVWQLPRTPGTIPNVAPDRLPEGLGRLPIPAKKRAFLRSVLPHIVAANLRVEVERDFLRDVLEREGEARAAAGATLPSLTTLARRYRVDFEGDGRESAAPALEELFRRVDVVPAGLCLAQAAIESGWGVSRFVHQGNNLFGQWVFSADKGIAPRRRPEGANYAVATFAGLSQAVTAYLRNLNTFWAYEELRGMREHMRAAGRGLDSERLAGGLLMYSERRDAYVAEVRRVLRSNRLEVFDDVCFTSTPRQRWERELRRQGISKTLRRTAPFPSGRSPAQVVPRVESGPHPTASDG